VIYQLPTINLKIKFTFRKDLNWQQICCRQQLAETALHKTDQVDRETIWLIRAEL
jgi:hypothetical protein